MKKSQTKTIYCAICGAEEAVNEKTSTDGIAPDWFIFNETINEFVCSWECDEIAEGMFNCGSGYFIEEI